MEESSLHQYERGTGTLVPSSAFNAECCGSAL